MTGSWGASRYRAPAQTAAWEAARLLDRIDHCAICLSSRRGSIGTAATLAGLVDFGVPPRLCGGERVIQLQARNGQFVGSQRYRVRANSDVAGRQERFVLMDTNGGCVESGDVVFLRTADGSYLRSYGDWRRFDARGTSDRPVGETRGRPTGWRRDSQSRHDYAPDRTRPLRSGGAGWRRCNQRQRDAGEPVRAVHDHRRRVVAGREPVRPIPSTGLRELHHRTRRPAASRAARCRFLLQRPRACAPQGRRAYRRLHRRFRGSAAGRPTRSERRRCRRRRYRSHSPSLGGRFPPPH